MYLKSFLPYRFRNQTQNGQLGPVKSALECPFECLPQHRKESLNAGEDVQVSGGGERKARLSPEKWFGKEGLYSRWCIIFILTMLFSKFEVKCVFLKVDGTRGASITSPDETKNGAKLRRGSSGRSAGNNFLLSFRPTESFISFCCQNHVFLLNVF